MGAGVDDRSIDIHSVSLGEFCNLRVIQGMYSLVIYFVTHDIFLSVQAQHCYYPGLRFTILDSRPTLRWCCLVECSKNTKL